MNKQERAFLDAIIENPEDDATRLIYSDWLEEQGQSVRAEFIRLQIEQSRLPEHSPRARKIQERVDEILDKHGDDWVRQIDSRLNLDEVMFQRGFVETVEFGLDDFVRLAKKLCKQAPVLGLEVAAPPTIAQYRRFAKCPEVASLRSLDLSLAAPSDTELMHLFASPHLVNLTTLDLGGGFAEEQTITHLLRSPSLNRLEDLRLTSTMIDGKALEQLARSDRMSQIERLELLSCHLEDRGVLALANSSKLDRLEHLDLCNTGCSVDAVVALLRAPSLKNLHSLELGFVSFDEAGTEALVEASQRFRFAFLNLAEGNFNADRVAQLESARFDDLEHWWLNFNKMGDRALARLLRKHAWPTLKSLEIVGTGAATNTLNALTEKGAFPMLYELEVGDNRLPVNAVRKLLESPLMSQLARLCLSNCGLNDEVGQLLLDSPHFEGLDELDLQENDFSVEMLMQLDAQLGDKFPMDSYDDEFDEFDDEMFWNEFDEEWE